MGPLYIDMRDEVDQLFFEKAFGLDYLDFEQKITMEKFMKLSQEEQREMRKHFGQICKQERQEREMM